MLNLLEPISLSIVVVGIIILAIFSSKLNIKLGPLNLGFHKSKFKDKIHEIININKDYIKKYIEYKDNIVKNQLNFAEGVIDDLNLDKLIREFVWLKIKSNIKENGFESFDSVGYSQYIGRKIDDINNIFTEHNVDFLHYHRDKIAEIFNHALITYNYWTDKIKELDEEYNKSLEMICE
jgi:hypothetical protein